ncbi:ABC transporter ATP-binding protein [Balneatrix alpica]|uniref:ABC transporter ATP-binding protein n=1 Tax=Balneatrix alpica TaxID=75684 RepID=A0ABV5Z877_9GAMM|nr:ABC transporter ATP-binding protein [Balneatrix alpica]
MSLHIDNLQLGYGRKKVLQNISLPPLQAGSLTAVIGPNAAGKSTFLKALAGLLSYQGSVRLGEQDRHSLSSAQWARLLGYLPQALPQATSLVAYELLFSACRAVCYDYSKAKIEARIEQVLDELGIRHLALMPMREMSGGQRQMVGLAQVLARDPQVLLLDEPTSALDLHWQLSVLQSVRRATQETAAIGLIAIHDINLALRYCDQLVVLAQGGLLAVGKPAEVLTPAILQQAYGIEGRIEHCSKGFPIVLTDRAIAHPQHG